MTEAQPAVEQAYRGLADLLSARPSAWDAPSLCEGWLVRHVVAHVSMPVRLTPERFGRELAAAGGDFQSLSDTVAARDASLPSDDLLAQLRSPQLHAWQPPGGGTAGAMSHAVIHSLDVTLALGAAPVASPDAVVEVLEQLAAHDPFGLGLDGYHLDTTDAGWSRGSGELVRTDSPCLVALLAGRTLPDGRTLRRG